MKAKFVWYDPKAETSDFMELLFKLRHLCPRQVGKQNGESWEKVQAIQNAIDDYAELETGNHEYFWNRPHSIG
jgi:hypothetical protein